MAETEILKDNPQAITPGWGWIELLQVVSLVMIPVATFLFPSGWSALPWFFAVLFFVVPFFLVRVPKAEAQDSQGVGDGVPKRVEPFHSRKYPGVYHIYKNCTEGDNIGKDNKARGTGGGRLCESCQELMEEEDGSR